MVSVLQRFPQLVFIDFRSGLSFLASAPFSSLFYSQNGDTGGCIFCIRRSQEILSEYFEKSVYLNRLSI